MTAVAAHARASARDDLERQVLGDVLLDVRVLREIAPIVTAADFAEPRHARLFAELVAIGDDAEQPLDLALIGTRLEAAGALAAIGGPAMLADLADAASSAQLAPIHARELRRASLQDRIRRAHGRLEIGPDPIARRELAEAESELEVESGRCRVIDLAALGFAGERLRELRRRPEPVSPLPGLLDPEPHLHDLFGKPKSGKTTFALDLARSWAQGLAPWPGAAPLPGSRVLVVSREQPVTRIDATLRRLARYAGTGDAWADRVVIVARDRDLAPEARRLLTLDAEGLALLRSALDAARGSDPFGFVVLDSLSRLKPPAIEERDNDAMTAWLDALEEIATECGVWIVLIHHVGHTADEGRREARGAGRGASSIAAVAQGVWLFERVKNNPRLRRVEIDGNALMPAEMHFTVADKDAPAGAIHYFEPSDLTAGYDPKKILGSDAIGVTELARRACGLDRGAKPAGKQLDLARRLLSTWQGAGLLDVTEGSHGPVIALKEGFRASD